MTLHGGRDCLSARVNSCKRRAHDRANVLRPPARCNVHVPRLSSLAAGLLVLDAFSCDWSQLMPNACLVV